METVLELQEVSVDIELEENILGAGSCSSSVAMCCSICIENQM